MSGMGLKLQAALEPKTTRTVWVELKNHKKLSHDLYQARAKAKLSQKELAATVPMAMTLISALENGQRRCVSEENFKLIEDVCKLLDLPAPERGYTGKSPVKAAGVLDTNKKKKEPLARQLFPAHVGTVRQEPEPKASEPCGSERQFKSALDLYNAKLITLAEFTNITKRIT